MPAVKVLNKKGWAVQLAHNSTEPVGEDHGFILIKKGDGTVFVDCMNFQHNRQDYYMPGWEKQLADLLKSVPEFQDGTVGDDAPCENGSVVPDQEKVAAASAVPEEGGLSEASTTDP